jgi:hypothetical protein
MSLFYMFENGSGSTWSKYLVPAEAYEVSRDSDGRVHISKVVPASIAFNNVKNLEIVHGDAYLTAALKKLLVSKETA